MGSVAPIGTAGGNSFYTPNDAYFESLLEDKIAVFKNYTMLPTFDTFTVLGHSILTSDNPESKQNMFLTWHQTYFRIYLFNLIIRYNLFRFTHGFGDDSVKVRDELEEIIGTEQIINKSSIDSSSIFTLERNGMNIQSISLKELPTTNKLVMVSSETEKWITAFPGNYAPAFPSTWMSIEEHAYATEFWENHVFVV